MKLIIIMKNQNIQVGDSIEASVEKVKNSSGIYSCRKDACAIKTRLMEIVKDTEYWNTFACYLHGQCSKQNFDEVMLKSLLTPEAKLLHNELIRSLLYNAHFSMRPPPGIQVPKAKVPKVTTVTQAASAPKTNSKFISYTAADLGHLPSINQLSSRISVLISGKNITCDSRATGIIFNELKSYIISILESSIKMINTDNDADKELKITTKQILHHISTNANVSSIVSQSILTKYTAPSA